MKFSSGRYKRPDAALSEDDMVVLLADALGERRARALIDRTVKLLGLAYPLSRLDGLRVLEGLTIHQDVVGVAARFAMMRFHLDGDSEPADPIGNAG